MPTSDQLITEAQNYANTAIVDGNVFIDRLLEIMDEAEYVVEDLPLPEYLQRYTSTWVVLPERPVVVITDPSAILPVAPDIVLSPISDGDVVVPDFDDNPPVLVFPAVPSAALPAVPATPTINEPSYPTAPTVTYPTAPTLVNPVLPIPPVVNLPEFTAQAPDDDLVVPTNTFSFAEVEYQSALLDAAVATLLEGLEDGSIGIDDDDEQRLFDRARARENEVAQQQINEIMQQASSRGFPLPPGDMLVSMDRARVELQRRMAGVNSDIMSKKADLYVQNRQFTLAEAQKYENMLLNYHNAVMERTLNVERTRIDVAIQVYNALVARYNARLQAYQTQATVFAQLVQAEIAKIEIYKAELDGARIQADLQRLILQNYEAQLAAINSMVGIYRTQLEATQIQANIERTRIEVFQAQIQGYSAQVQAKVAEFNMYTSQVNAERAKVDAYQAEVNSYASRVQASQVKSEIALSRLRTEVEQANALVGVYRARIDGYAAELRGQVETINARLGKYNAETRLYEVDYNQLAQSFRLNAELANFEVTERLKNAEIAQENAKIALDAWTRTRQIKNQASGVAGGYYGARAQAALNGINALISKAE